MPFAIAAHRIALENPLVQFDPDTRDFIMRVERADGQALETRTRQALDAFVRGCKADGIWDAVKACCVMMGARTLAGALTPLKGVAPTNFNFVSGDYNRKTGLKGDGTTKYLNSNRAGSSDPQNSKHCGVLVTEATSGSGYYLSTQATTSGNTRIQYNGTSIVSAVSTTIQSVIATASPTGLVGASRNNSADFGVRFSGSTTTATSSSNGNSSSNFLLYVLATSSYSNARLSFYSIGESLDLALLDARVTALSNAIAAAF